MRVHAARLVTLFIATFAIPVAAWALIAPARAQNPKKFERVVPAKPRPAAPETTVGTTLGTWCYADDAEKVRLTVSAGRVVLSVNRKNNNLVAVNTFPGGPCINKQDERGTREYRRCHLLLGGVSRARAAFSFAVEFLSWPKDPAKSATNIEMHVAFKFDVTDRNQGVLTQTVTKWTEDGKDRTGEASPDTKIFRRCDAE